MYLAHVAFALPYSEIGIIFGRSRRLVARACGVIEDARDDAAFDAALAGLEAAAEVLRDAEKMKYAA